MTAFTWEASQAVAVLSKSPPRSLGWAATRWSLVADLERSADPNWQSSWDYLTAAYRRPMELYARRLLVRAPGGAANAEDAADVVQAFLTACVEKCWLSRADSTRGRFRAYMQVLLRRYVTGWLRQKLAQKRRPERGKHLLPLLADDSEGLLPASHEQDLADFERNWTEIAVERALKRLLRENERYHMVIHDLIETDGKGSSDLADRTGLKPGQLPVLKHRARRRFSHLFEDELRATVSDAATFEDEWRALQPYMP